MTAKRSLGAGPPKSLISAAKKVVSKHVADQDGLPVVVSHGVQGAADEWFELAGNAFNSALSELGMQDVEWS